MAILKRKKADSEIEKKIITGMIVSKDFLQEVYPFFDLSYLQNSYIEKVARWCLEHYSYYEQAPFATIQDIFNYEKNGLQEEESDLIRILLLEVSKKYQVGEGINVPYLVDRTIEFCKTRELEITAGNIQVLLSKGDLKGAEEQVDNFRRVQRLTSDWVNPFDEEEVFETFQSEEIDFFRFPGVLGNFLGNFERGWLVGLSGAFKGGKTWFAQEFAVIGILSGLRVAFFSLEMTSLEMKKRLYKRFTASGDKQGEYIYPVFDCKKNQYGTCIVEDRCQHIDLINHNGKIPDYDNDNPYRVCSVCRNKSREYEAATWFEPLIRPEYNITNVYPIIKAFSRQLKYMLRLKSYPRFSANLSDIRRDLNILEQSESFVPDIIIVDYADILKPENSSVSGIEKEDRSWIALSQLAAERHCLVIAPTQVKIDALNANTIKQTHMARWIGKLGHVDVMLTVNQSDVEKRHGRARVGVIAHRHKEFHPGATVTVLQQLSLGQVHLDSDFVIEENRGGGEE